MKIQDRFQSFLQLYFYQLEHDLNQNPQGLEAIKFQSEEANTDEYLKRFFQSYIKKNNQVKEANIQKLSIRIDEEDFTVKVSELLSYRIEQVFVLEELTDEHKKEIIESKSSVYTNPGLYLLLTDDSNRQFYQSVELKSTKDNNIPGSSVQQVSPFEWVIFVKRTQKSVNVSTGYYINSITEKMPFPDRSPRPQVGFKTLQQWNSKHRKEVDGVLQIENRSELNEKKLCLLDDWVSFLATEWLNIVKSEKSKSNEKWFNMAIRKFTILLLDHYDGLTLEEKNSLEQRLLNNLK